MPVRISIVPATRIVHSRFSGTLTIVDFLEGRAEVAKDPAFAATFSHILDFTDVVSVDIEPQTLLDLAAMPSIFEPGAVQVIVAPARSAVSQLARTFRNFATGSGRDVRIAESFDEARTLVFAFG